MQWLTWIGEVIVEMVGACCPPALADAVHAVLLRQEVFRHELYNAKGALPLLRAGGRARGL